MENYAIETFNINKKFDSCYANKGISIRIAKGEIHALLGENGAGKSTFMSILSGTCCADDGIVRIYDNLKVGTVRQSFELVKNYTVLENIILGNEIPKRFVFNKKNAKKGFGFKMKKIICGFFFGIFNFFCSLLLLVDKKTSREKIKNIMDKYKLYVDLDVKIKDIGADVQQKVEILKTLYCDNDVLIFDEPTAFLAPNEKENLLEIMRNLRNSGKTIIFATHKLNEIFSVADRVSVIKKGELVLTTSVAETNLNFLLETMISKKIKILDKKKKVFNFKNRKEILKVERLHVFDYSKKKYIVSDVNFNIRKGEIVSIVGFGGYSQDALIHSIVGLRKYKGSIKLNDVELTVNDINERNKLGMSYIPDDCCERALISNFSVKDNLIIHDFSSCFTNFFGFMCNKKINDNAEKLIKKYNIQANDGITSITSSMSSGNQQKIVVAREMERESDLLVAVQPTRGIDAITSKMIRSYLLEQRNKGKAILLVSFDLDEVFTVSDRILAMFEDRIVGEFLPENITQQELNLYMSGVKSN